MESAINFINEKTNNFKPVTGIILGSGLGDFADEFEAIRVPYSDIPGFQKSHVAGHKGLLVFAEVAGKPVVMMQGRYHFYEGHSMQTVTYPVKVMKKLGVQNLIITNAAGLLHKEFEPGDLMLIADHINFMGTNPLIGMNDNDLGPRFPDQSDVFTKTLREKAKAVAKSINLEVKEGVYCALTGPTYETPAEVKMVRNFGADAVGMSTVPEAIVANWCGMNVLGISCLTNFACGVIDQPLSHQEVIETADRIKESFKKYLYELVKAI
ncbi:MAG: purine-nucleoside phosphorylase [Candidatus Gastranaerophilales bacterium]|nr:purine-nucleoside phosphorylase [Candidatus Gastranaerophilales bacterium]